MKLFSMALCQTAATNTLLIMFVFKKCMSVLLFSIEKTENKNSLLRFQTIAALKLHYCNGYGRLRKEFG